MINVNNKFSDRSQILNEMKVKITAILTLLITFSCTGDLEDKIDELSEQLAVLQDSSDLQKQDMMSEIEALTEQNNYNRKELEKLDEVMNVLAILNNRTQSDSMQLVEFRNELNSVTVNVETLERISKTHYGDINLTSINNTNAYDRYEYLNGNMKLDNRAGSIRVSFKFREITGQLHLINVRENWPGLANWFYYLEKVRELRIEGSTHPTLSYLSHLKHVSVLRLVDNPGLTKLEGLENVSTDVLGNGIWFFEAENNPNLSDFCTLQELFAASPPSSWYVSGNTYNPSLEQVKKGECKP